MLSPPCAPLEGPSKLHSSRTVLVCTQAVLPDMPRAASAPVANVQAQASPAQQHTQQHSQQHSQQLSQQHSGQYGLVDEDEDVGHDEHAEVPSHNTSDEHQAALQLQEDEEEGARARQPAHVTPCLHPPPLPHQPMCRLFRYTCGLCSLCAGRCKGYHAWCLVRVES